MAAKFNAAEFVQGIGVELVQRFESARKVDSPGGVGAAIEGPVRKRLKQILPADIDVGSGYVIDATGQVSNQIDVILYESGICPVFQVNETQGVAYYPVEGVLAVGEVKSRIGKKELKDAFAKIASVKRLERQFLYKKDGDNWVGRRYCEHSSSVSNAFKKDNTNMGHVYGFILSQEPRGPIYEKFGGVKKIVDGKVDAPTLSRSVSSRKSLLEYYTDNVTARATIER